MTDVVYFSSEPPPQFAEDQRWLIVEASGDGRFFGTGSSWKKNGEWLGYASLAEDDVSIEAAIAAARRWASKYEVPTIWVELTTDTEA